MILPISGLVAKPLFGGLADKFKIHKTLFLIFQAIVAIAMFTIHFIPEVDKSANVTLTCNGDASLEICSKVGFSDEVVRSAITDSLHRNVSCQVFKFINREVFVRLYVECNLI